MRTIVDKDNRPLSESCDPGKEGIDASEVAFQRIRRAGWSWCE